MEIPPLKQFQSRDFTWLQLQTSSIMCAVCIWPEKCSFAVPNYLKKTFKSQIYSNRWKKMLKGFTNQITLSWSVKIRIGLCFSSSLISYKRSNLYLPLNDRSKRNRLKTERWTLKAHSECLWLSALAIISYKSILIYKNQK